MHSRHLAIMVLLAASAALSGCKATTNGVAPQVQNHHCIDLAKGMSLQGRQHHAPAKLQGAAEHYMLCANTAIDNAQPPEQQELRMQWIAHATLAYLEGGDVQGANAALTQFRQQFPGKDLYLPDYTSFLDTATALMSPVSPQQEAWARLNINNALRNALLRQHHWQTH